MPATVRDRNRKVRKDALREMLSKKCTVEQVFVIAKKLEDGYLSLEASQINALKASADIKMKLINKYLPELKATEVTGEEGAPLIPASIKIVYE